MKKNMFMLGTIIALIPAIANAGALDLLDTNLRGAITGAMGALQTTAILWLSSFVLIQFLITNIGLLKSGADIEAVFGKLLGSLLWFGFCFYVMSNGGEFIDKVSKGFFTTAGSISGAGSFDAGGIISQGADLAGMLLGKINSASGITDLFMPSLIGGLLGVVIIATSALIAFKVFLIKIETMLIIMLSPLSFAFLGLNALKDQGIAPFKSLISLLYRVMFLALILKTMGGMSDNLIVVINSITSDSIDGIWSTVFAAVIAYALLGFLAFKSDSLASSLASGSTSFGTADVASAAALGAAAGAAVATGGVAAAAGTAKGGQSMGDFLKSLGGGGGSITNASNSGGGGRDAKPVGTPPTPPPKAPEPTLQSLRSDPSHPSQKATPGTGGESRAAMPGGDSLKSADTGLSAGSAEMPPTATSGTGSGATAGISAPASATDQKLDKLLDSLGQQAPKSPTFGERMAAVNDHVARESAATHVSINTHHAD